MQSMDVVVAGYYYLSIMLFHTHTHTTQHKEAKQTKTGGEPRCSQRVCACTY